MSTQEVPWPWASLMIDRGFVARTGAANISGLARRCDLAVETVRRAIHGVGTPKPETVAALVDVLGPEVEDLLGVSIEMGEYVPPSEAMYLDIDQRKALDQLIRVMARPAGAPRGRVDMRSDVSDLERRRNRLVEQGLPVEAAAGASDPRPSSTSDDVNQDPGGVEPS